MTYSKLVGAATRFKHLAWLAAGLLGLTTSIAALSQTQTQPPTLPNAVASVDAFRPADGDLSAVMLQSIFGDWEGSAKIPFLGAAMEQLNLFALAFGTLMFTFVAVIGTINSAQDGEVLGKKWSSTWVPLRFLMGTALMVPLTTGYSTAQHIILWLALTGSGGASMLWGSALTGFSGSQAAAAVQSPVHKEGLEALFKDMLQAQVCMATLTQAENIPYGVSTIATSESGTYGTKISFGQTNGTDRRDQCGSVLTLRYDFPDKDGGEYQLRSSTRNWGGLTSGDLDGAGGKPTKDSQATSNAMRAYINAQRDVLLRISGSSGPLQRAAAEITAKSSETGIAGQPLNIPPNIQRAIVLRAIKESSIIYSQAMVGPIAAAISSIQGDLDSFLVDSKKAGWVMAGATFFQMTAIRSKMNKVVREVPEFNNESWYTRVLADGVGTKNLGVDLSALKLMVDDGFVGDSSNSWNPGDDLTMWLAKKFAFDPKSDKHAFVQIKDTGDYMMIAGEAIGIAAWAATQLAETDKGGAMIATATKAVSSGGPVMAAVKFVAKGVAKLILPLAMIIAGALFFAGVTMSLILPTLPFLMSIGAVVGWLMAVFSAVVAAPIWLAGHLNPDGDGFAGQRAAGGYMILLETATRPIFIVLGLIGAFLIMDPVMRFTSIAFEATVSSVQGNSVTGLPSMVVLICLYVVIIWTIVRTTMSFVHHLAAQVYTWIGGQFAGYDKAAEFSNAADQSNRAAAGGMMQAKAGLAAVSLLSKNSKKGGGDADDPKQKPKKT